MYIKIKYKYLPTVFLNYFQQVTAAISYRKRSFYRPRAYIFSVLKNVGRHVFQSILANWAQHSVSVVLINFDFFRNPSAPR